MLLKWEVKQNSSGVLNFKRLFQVSRFFGKTVFGVVGVETTFVASKAFPKNTYSNFLF
jgi:hypothetical protein